MFTVYILNVFAVTFPRHFVLKPASKPIYVLQGHSGQVTCEADKPSVSTLKWEKQQDDQSYVAVPNSQVNITKDANYVRATLNITNAQFGDTGTYKCTVHINAQYHHMLTKIEVKGMFVSTYFIDLARVVQTLDSAIHRIYHYLVDN